VFAYASGNAVFANYLSIPAIPHAGELLIFCASLAGSGLGFLWFNSYPAQVFMGDVGALAIGAAIGVLAVIVRQELVVLVMGGIFVLETASVILQVASFKLTGKRIFRMAPIHHHFELKAGRSRKSSCASGSFRCSCVGGPLRRSNCDERHLNKAAVAVIVGLGRTGFSCARYLRKRGWRVAVTDTRAKPPELKRLLALDADIEVRLGALIRASSRVRCAWSYPPAYRSPSRFSPRRAAAGLRSWAILSSSRARRRASRGYHWHQRQEHGDDAPRPHGTARGAARARRWQLGRACA